MTAEDPSCVFCEIIAGRVPATIVAEDAETIAIVDLRQFHAGHVLVIPRVHVNDIRTATEDLAVAVMRMVARVMRAVDRAFPADGISVWHSAGEGANQEVPHLHVHVHPRFMSDHVLEVYPSAPGHPDRETLDAIGARVRMWMQDS